jgi:hypothetical protein
MHIQVIISMPGRTVTASNRISIILVSLLPAAVIIDGMEIEVE